MTRSPHHHRRRAARGGFTLLELIVASAIAATIALTVYTAMAAAFKARNSANRQMIGPRQAAVALDIIEQDLQSATRAGGTLYGAFYGYALGSPGAETDSLSFITLGRDDAMTRVATNVEDPLADGPRRVEIALRADATGAPVIMRRVQRNLLTQTTITTEDETIAAHVRALSIRYFDGSGWSEEWDSSQRTDSAIPQAVQITIELATHAATVDPSALQGVPPVYRATRIVPLAVAAPPSDSTSLTGGGQ